MEYLMLASGNIRGARKARLKAVPAHLVGHYVDGIPMTFDADQFGAALPAQHKRAWVEGRAQAWLTSDKPDSPWAVHVYGTRAQRLATYFLQPLRDS